MAKAKKAALERVYEVRTHWSQFLADEGIGCGEVPTYAEKSKTPEEAWAKAGWDHLIEVMNHFNIDAPKACFDDNGYLIDSDAAADIIHKKYPTPPRRVMTALGRWLKKKPDPESY